MRNMLDCSSLRHLALEGDIWNSHPHRVDASKRCNLTERLTPIGVKDLHSADALQRVQHSGSEGLQELAASCQQIHFIQLLGLLLGQVLLDEQMDQWNGDRCLNRLQRGIEAFIKGGRPFQAQALKLGRKLSQPLNDSVEVEP